MHVSALYYGVVRNCHHFHERTQHLLGCSRSWATVCFLKVSLVLIVVHCDFDNGSQNQHFQKYSFGGRGNKKQHSVYALDNVDISGRPLRDHSRNDFTCMYF